MNGLRSNNPRHGEASSLDALNRTIDSLEARIESLMKGSSANVAKSPRPQPTSINASSTPATASKGSAVNRFDPFTEIRKRQQLLDEQRQRSGNNDLRANDVIMSKTPAQSSPHFQTHGIEESLVNLRHDLKKDIADGVAREMQSLHHEIRSIRSLAEQQPHNDDMREELLRLSQSIAQLEQNRMPFTDGLRSEVDELRSSLGALAREDSLNRMEQRWDEVETQLRSIDTTPLKEEIIALAYRLDDLKDQLGNMSDSPSVRALEDKLFTVAKLVERLATQMTPNDESLNDQFQALDTRLDEISRAIAANHHRSAPQQFDNDIAQRLETRLNSLSTQIEDLTSASSRQHEPSREIASRIDSLAHRIEDIAVDRQSANLGQRLDELSNMLHTSQANSTSPDLTNILSEIAHKIDAFDTSALNDQLALRLEMLSKQIEQIDARQAQPSSESSEFVYAFTRLEERLGDIATRLDESTNAEPRDAGSLTNLENQIAHLSALISQPSYLGADASAHHNGDRLGAIEEQLATNDEYIIEVARQAAEAVLDAYMRNNLSSPSSVGDMQMLTGLANDLRNLEALTRSTEEKTARTFEALHDTLVQIAYRLDNLDVRSENPVTAEQPNAAPMPLPAFAQEPANESILLNSISKETYNDHSLEEHVTTLSEPVSRAFKPAMSGTMHHSDDVAVSSSDIDSFIANKRRELTQAPAVAQTKENGGILAGLRNKFRLGTAKTEPQSPRIALDQTPPLDPVQALSEGSEHELLEPGSGAPDVKKILERVRASQAAAQAVKQETSDSRADVIAAARRAALAAAQETMPSEGLSSDETLSDTQSRSTNMAKFRRPLMLGVGAVLLALLAVPIVNVVKSKLDTAPPATEVMTEAAPASTSSVITNEPVTIANNDALNTELLAQTEALIKQADTVPNTIDTQVIGGAPLTEIRQEPSASVKFEPATEQSVTAPAELIEIPVTIQPASLAKAASEGDELALFEVASRFIDGRDGVDVNQQEAAKFYKLAADRGHALSQYRLASMYEKAIGIDRNLPLAKRYYEMSAKNGNAGAMHNLAVLLTSGTFGEPNFEEASKWFIEAANHGVHDSQYNIAILYARGNGLTPDTTESYKWFAIAAKAGDVDAAAKRDEIAKTLTPGQLANAKAKVEAWTPASLNETANAATLPDEWVGQAVTTASVDMDKAIRNIQAILNNNGFDAGTPDGKIGAKTVAAIKSFQESIGLTPDGLISDKLVTELLERNK